VQIDLYSSSCVCWTSTWSFDSSSCAQLRTRGLGVAQLRAQAIALGGDARERVFVRYALVRRRGRLGPRFRALRVEVAVRNAQQIDRLPAARVPQLLAQVQVAEDIRVCAGA